MPYRLLILDNNCLQRLSSARARARLRSNLKLSGREFWPSAVNVLEATKTRDREKRTRMLSVLAELSEDAHALPMPSTALRLVGEALTNGSSLVTWSEPRLTRFFRDPESVSDDEAAAAREH